MRICSSGDFGAKWLKLRSTLELKKRYRGIAGYLELPHIKCYPSG